MTLIRPLLALTLLCILPRCEGVAYDGFTAEGEKGREIVEAVRAAHEKSGFIGAVLAAEKGKIIAAVAVGTTGGKRDEQIQVDTLFEIASCSKSFTAQAVMLLVESKKLSLDDPIEKFLRGVPEDCSAITVRHLLQHTSGIPGTNASGHGKNLAKVLPLFLKGGPRHEPGARYEYWNQGYALLSEVVAQASGKSYTRYCRQAVFEPCGMKHTCFNGHRPPRGVLVATGRSQRGDRSALDHPYGNEYGFQYRGMGGIVTNLPDLWRWDRAVASGRLLSKESLEEMTTPGEGGYGLGWRAGWLPEDRAPYHYHTGSVRGFLAAIERYPSRDGCLFVLCASDDGDAFGAAYSNARTLLLATE